MKRFRKWLIWQWPDSHTRKYEKDGLEAVFFMVRDAL